MSYRPYQPFQALRSAGLLFSVLLFPVIYALTKISLARDVVLVEGCLIMAAGVIIASASERLVINAITKAEPGGLMASLFLLACAAWPVFEFASKRLQPRYPNAYPQYIVGVAVLASVIGLIRWEQVLDKLQQAFRLYRVGLSSAPRPRHPQTQPGSQVIQGGRPATHWTVQGGAPSRP